MIYRDRNMQYVQSIDKGKTWSEPVVINPKQVLNSAGSIIIERNKIQVVYPSSVNMGSGSYFQLFSTFSTDNGQSWSEPIQITNSLSQSLSPRLVRLINGIALVWYELEEHQVKTKLDINKELVKNIIEKTVCWCNTDGRIQYHALYSTV